MAYTFHELRKKTLAELKEIAAGIDNEAVKGYTQMHKDHVLKAICTALAIDMHEHHVAHLDRKQTIKARLHALRRERDEAIGAHDPQRLKKVRVQMGRIKHWLRKNAE